MSDGSRLEPEFTESVDAEAPTERDPRVHPSVERTPSMPPRGVAWSVLWWLEGDVETAQRG